MLTGIISRKNTKYS